MAVPSRIYFVVTLFALVVTLISVPFTVAVLTCESRPDANLTGLPCKSYTDGARLFLVLASLFAIVFTIASWRALRASARRDAELRKQRANQPGPAVAASPPQGKDESPPGYQ